MEDAPHCAKRVLVHYSCMGRSNLAVADFQAVLALARHGSFRAASDALGLSASAMSRQISALEQRLEVRLFDRDTRNLRPTASGLVFARLAERLVNTAEDVLAEFEMHASARRGRLTIAGLPSVTAGLLPTLLRAFIDDHPDVDLHIMDAPSGGVIDAVELGAADIGFTAGTPSARSRLTFQPLFDEEFVAIGAPDGPLRDQRPYGWQEILAMPFIAMAPGTSVRELIDAACQRVGHTLAPRFEVAHLATTGAMIAQGLGVTALPTLTLPVLRMNELVERRMEGFGVRRRIGLVRHPSRSLSPLARAFLEHVRTDARSTRG